MSSMLAVSRSLADTEAVAKRFLANLRPEVSEATVVGLVGSLGAGKTTFIQAVAKLLGVTWAVTSPTFVLQKIYQLPRGQAFSRLIHLDCYRLDGPQDLAQLGWAELVTDPRNLILIEWADKVSSILPPTAYQLNFRFINETTREISWSVPTHYPV